MALRGNSIRVCHIRRNAAEGSRLLRQDSRHDVLRNISVLPEMTQQRGRPLACPARQARKPVLLMAACLAATRLSVATVAVSQRQRGRQRQQQQSRQAEHTNSYLFHDGSPFVDFDLSKTRLLTKRGLDQENAVAQEEAGRIDEPARRIGDNTRMRKSCAVVRPDNRSNPLRMRGRRVRLTFFQDRIRAIRDGPGGLVAAGRGSRGTGKRGA